MHSEAGKARHIMLPVSFVVGALVGHLLIHLYEREIVSVGSRRLNNFFHDTEFAAGGVA